MHGRILKPIKFNVFFSHYRSHNVFMRFSIKVAIFFQIKCKFTNHCAVHDDWSFFLVALHLSPHTNRKNAFFRMVFLALYLACSIQFGTRTHTQQLGYFSFASSRSSLLVWFYLLFRCIVSQSPRFQCISVLNTVYIFRIPLRFHALCVLWNFCVFCHCVKHTASILIVT